LLLLQVWDCDDPWLLVPSEDVDGGEDIFDPRLYRVIRSMCSELDWPGAVPVVLGVTGAGMGGWKEGGGYR